MDEPSGNSPSHSRSRRNVSQASEVIDPFFLSVEDVLSLHADQLELYGGLQSISYEREATTSVYSGVTGQLVNRTQAAGAAQPSAMLVESRDRHDPCTRRLKFTLLKRSLAFDSPLAIRAQE